MTFLQDIGLGADEGKPLTEIFQQGVSSEKEPHLKSDEVKPNDKKKWGTPEYKNSLVYIYCTPEDKERIKHFAKILGIDMKDVLHKLLFAAEIAIPNPGCRVSVMTVQTFMDTFMKVPTNDKPQ